MNDEWTSRKLRDAESGVEKGFWACESDYEARYSPKKG
jgi:hypothetical protein